MTRVRAKTGALQRRLQAMTFRNRLVLLSAAATATAVVLASAITYLVVRGELRSQVDERLRDVVADVIPPQEVEDPKTGRTVLVVPSEPYGGKIAYVQVVRPDRTIVKPTDSNVHLATDKRTYDVAAGKRGPFFEDRTLNGQHVRVYTARLASGDAVQAVRTLEEVDDSLQKLGFALILLSLGGIALAVWLGRMVARTALRPVGELTHAAEHVARTRDLSRRMSTQGKDELSRLGASFNTMLEALETSQRAQRQLVADASHELRTPLTSLRTNIEVLADADLLSPEDRRRLLDDVVAQLEDLTVLVTDLVDLARGEEAEQVPEDVRLDLLVADVLERSRRNAPDKDFVEALEPCLVRGVPARLDRAVSNLLDNAAKWSPLGGRVQVSVRRGEVAVRDFGEGIAEADLPFIFDRFYRAPSARRLPGSGLGLAIARHIVEAHGGTISAERPPGGGALFRIRLPIVEEAELPEAPRVHTSAS